VTVKTLAVFRKEAIDTLRDGRSIFAIFVFPFLLYPAMLLFISWMHMKEAEEAKVVNVVNVGERGVGVVGSITDSTISTGDQASIGK